MPDGNLDSLIDQGFKSAPAPKPLFDEHFDTYGEQHGIDPNVGRAVAQVESDMNPGARNPRSTATGLMQITEPTARLIQKARQLPEPIDRTDPQASIDHGSWLIGDNTRRLGTLKDGLMAFKAGTNDPAVWNGNPENVAWLPKVQAAYKGITGNELDLSQAAQKKSEPVASSDTPAPGAPDPWASSTADMVQMAAATRPAPKPAPVGIGDRVSMALGDAADAVNKLATNTNPVPQNGETALNGAGMPPTGYEPKKSVLDSIPSDPGDLARYMGAPVRPEIREAARVVLERATPEQRAAVAAQPGWVGSVAQAALKDVAASDEMRATHPNIMDQTSAPQPDTIKGISEEQYKQDAIRDASTHFAQRNTGLVNAFMQAGTNFGQTAAGAVVLAGDLLHQAMDTKGVHPVKLGTEVSDYGKAIWGRLEAAQNGLATPTQDSIAAMGVMSGIVSAINMTPSIAAGLITRSPGLALKTMAGQQGLQSYGQARLTEAPLKSAAYAGLYAATEYWTEKLPIEYLANSVGRTSLTRLVIGTQIREQPGEQVAQHLEDWFDWQFLHPEKSLDDYYKGRVDAATQTAISTAVSTALLSGAAHAAAKMNPDRFAAQNTADDTAREAIQKLRDMFPSDKINPKAAVAGTPPVAQPGEPPAPAPAGPGPAAQQNSARAQDERTFFTPTAAINGVEVAPHIDPAQPGAQHWVDIHGNFVQPTEQQPVVPLQGAENGQKPESPVSAPQPVESGKPADIAVNPENSVTAPPSSEVSAPAERASPAASVQAGWKGGAESQPGSVTYERKSKTGPNWTRTYVPMPMPDGRFAVAREEEVGGKKTVTHMNGEGDWIAGLPSNVHDGDQAPILFKTEKEALAAARNDAIAEGGGVPKVKEIKDRKGTEKWHPSVDSMLVAISKLGGIHVDHMQDITGEKSVANLPGRAFIRNHGSLFRKGGKNMDDIVPRLREEGYVPHDLDAIDAERWVMDAINKDLNQPDKEEHHYSVSAQDARNARDAEANAKAEEEHYLEQERLQEERDANLIPDEYTEYDLADAEYNELSPQETRAVESAMDALRARFPEPQHEAAIEEWLEKLGRETEGEPKATFLAIFRSRLYEIGQILSEKGNGRNAEADQAERGQEDAQPHAEQKRSGYENSPIELKTQTADELAAKEKADAAKKAADNADAQKAEAKRKADTESGQLTLTGSDRKTDVAEAHGQQSLFQERDVYHVKQEQHTQDLFQDDELLHAARGENPPVRPAAEGGNLHTKEVVSLRESPTVPGVYYVSSQLVTVGERKVPYAEIKTAAQAAESLAHFTQFAVEHINVLVTDKAGKPLAVVGHYRGEASQAAVYLEPIKLELARIADAENIWVLHNHPSGTKILSDADLRLGDAFNKAATDLGIHYSGVLALAKQKDGTIAYQVADRNQDLSTGVVPSDSERTVSVPFVERELRGYPDAESVDSPKVARQIVKRIAGNTPGILFLSGQNQPTAFVPFSPQEASALRVDKRFMKLARAASGTGAVSAIISNPGSVMSSDVYNNLAGALNSLGIKTLDVIDHSAITQQEGSAAERGNLIHGTYFKSLATERGTLNADEVSRVVDPIARNLGLDPQQVHVVQSWRQVPLMLRPDPETRGAYDPKNGHIWLVADNLTARTLEPVLLHEAVGHKGFEEMNAHPAVRKILKEVYASRAAQIQHELRYGFLQGYDFDLRSEASQLQAAREFIAHEAEDGREQTFWQRLVAAIREFLRDIGMVHDYTDGDILQLLQRSKDHLQEGRVRSRDGTSELDPAFHSHALTPAYLEKLEQRVDKAYEKGDPRAEELDAQLAQMRADLEEDGTREPDDTDYSTVQGQFVQGYMDLMDGSRMSREDVLANLRDVVTDNGGTPGTDEQLIDAAQDAYDHRNEINSRRNGAAFHSQPAHRQIYGIVNGHVIAHAELLGGAYTVRIAKDPSNLLNPGIRIEQAANLTEVAKLMNSLGATMRYTHPQSIRNPNQQIFTPILLPETPTMRQARKDRTLNPMTWGKTMKAGTRDMMIALQDRYKELYMTEEAIRKSAQAGDGGSYNESTMPYRQAELAVSSAVALVDDAEHNIWRPMMKLMAENKLTFKDVGWYLAARGAPERNFVIEQRDPNNQAGSGITTADAIARTKALEAGPLGAVYKEIGVAVDKVNQLRLDYAVKTGLISEATRRLWEQTYPHYVPFKFLDEDESIGERLGPGFQAHQVSRTATGRHTAFGEHEAEALLSTIKAQLDGTYFNGANNQVSQQFLNMVAANPSTQWDIQKITYKPSIDPVTGIVVTRPSKSQFGPNVLRVFVDGDTITVHINNPRLAEAMTQSGGGISGPMRLIAAWTRFQALVATSANPQFIFTNLMRDAQEAGIYISAEQGAKILAQTAKGVPTAWMAIMAHERNKGPLPPDATGMVKTAREFYDSGARVQWRGAVTPEATMKSLETLLKQSGTSTARKTWEATKSVAKVIADANMATENAIRLSLYASMRNNGYSIPQSAHAAKNVTVNFERRGTAGPIINALYMFFNANVQGQYRMVKALMTNNKVRAAALALILAGAANDWWNRAISDRDADGKKIWDKLPDDVKDRAFIVMGKDREFVKIPLSYSFNVFMTLGRNISATLAHMASGGKDGTKPVDAALNSFISLVNSFNAFGGNIDPKAPLGKQLMTVLLPTFADPFYQAQVNMNAFGTPIYPEQKAHGDKPPSERYWQKTPQRYIEFAKWLNAAGGGNEIREGKVAGLSTSVSPNMIQHVVRTLTGGAGDFVVKAAVYVDAKMRGEELPSTEVPIKRIFHGELRESDTSQRFYENVHDAHIAAEEVKYQYEHFNPDKAHILAQAHKDERHMDEVAKVYESEINAMRKQVETIRALPGMDQKVKADKIKTLNDRVIKRMQEFNRKYDERVPKD